MIGLKKGLLGARGGDFSLLAETVGEIAPVESVDGTVTIGFNVGTSSAVVGVEAKVPQNGMSYFPSGTVYREQDSTEEDGSSDVHLTYGINNLAGLDLFGAGSGSAGTITQNEYTSTWDFTGVVADLVFSSVGLVLSATNINQTINFGSGGRTLAIVFANVPIGGASNNPETIPISALKFDGVDVDWFQVGGSSFGFVGAAIINTDDGDPLVQTTVTGGNTYVWNANYVSLA